MTTNNMASLLTEPLFKISGQAPPPSKNFYCFSVTKTQVIWRWWTISMRAVDRFSKPGQVKESFEDFLDDTKLQREVSMVFGHHILESSKALCRGHYNYLELLSDSLILRIISYLELEDVGRLGQSSLRFRKLCESEEFWEQAVRQRCFTISAEVASLSSEVGWRSIFFTSKLQLQKLISRRKLKMENQQNELVSNPAAKEEDSPDERPGTNLAFASQEELNSNISSDLSLCTDLSAGWDTDSTDAFILTLNQNPDADSHNPVPDHFLEYAKYCEAEVQRNSHRIDLGDRRAVAN